MAVSLLRIILNYATAVGTTIWTSWRRPGLVASALLLGVAGVAGAQEPAATARRVAGTALLAAQEYRLGVEGGRIIAAPEVEEAKLFLEEARRTAGRLPAPVGAETVAGLDSIAALVGRTGDPDIVSRDVARLLERISTGLGVTLDEIPSDPPPLARGREIYQAACASCHGSTGAGDGPAGRGLEPKPANLADAAGLRGSSPLDFYRRVTIGVAGTAMLPYESAYSPEDRWAVALYASVLRLPRPAGAVPEPLRNFGASARMSDAEILAALGPAATDASLAAVRTHQPAGSSRVAVADAFSTIRRRVDSAFDLAVAGRSDEARSMALDAYIAFEQVERELRVKNSGLTMSLEESFSALRTRAGTGASPQQLREVRQRLARELERAERTVGDRLSAGGLFAQAFVILLREGLEAILVIGALMAFLVKSGNAHRRRDIHLGVGAALLLSILTGIALETLFAISPARQEILEGAVMLAATLTLFYVSYWLLSKIEVAKWNRFVKGKVQEALGTGSVFALASVAFLAVYREGFETVLFFKALTVSGGGTGLGPIVLGVAAGGVVLAAVYVAVNRFGVRLPLKPLFGVTSALLYYMAVVFAGQGVAELQEGGAMSLTPIAWAPRIPTLGIYPTVESLLAQGVLVVLALVAVLWIFVIAPRRLPVTSVLVPETERRETPVRRSGEAASAPPERKELIRSIERIEADLAEVRAELDRMRDRVETGGQPGRHADERTE
jgi:high-affinity iron transporter